MLFRRAGEGFAQAGKISATSSRSSFRAKISRPQAGDAIRAFHAGVHDPRHLAGAAQDGLRRRAGARARLRDRPLLRPRAGSARGQARLTGVRWTPTTARIAKLLYPNARIRHEDFTKARLPETSISPSAIRRSRTAPSAPTTRPATAPFPARLFHRAVDRAVEAGWPRRLRHLAAGPWTRSTGQRARISPPWPTWSARSGCRRAP